MKNEMKKNGRTSDKLDALVSSVWGSTGWRVMHHAPCKNGKIWIVTDCTRNVWDLVKWESEEWTSERGIEMNMTHCKLLSIGANASAHPRRDETLNQNETETA